MTSIELIFASLTLIKLSEIIEKSIRLNFLSAAGLRTPVTLLLSTLFALMVTTNVQADGYTANITTAYPQLAIASTSPQVAWYGGGCGNNVASANPYNTCDDAVSPVMPIGFTFNFAGTPYTTWSMSTNGVIFFETGAVGTGSTGGSSYTPNNLPTTIFGSPPKPALMPFWADLWKSASANGVLDANSPSQPANASFIQHQMLTVSGAQVLVIQLKKVGYYGAAGTLVNMQIQLWSTGQIIYSYGNIQAIASNPNLRIGLQHGTGLCNTLANNQTTALSNQSFIYSWDASATGCTPLPAVNHYEIRHDGAATLCAEPVTVLACSSATAPCPAANIIASLITAQVTVAGVPAIPSPTNPNISPSSFNIQPSEPLQTANITWATGSSGTAALGSSAAVRPAGALRCTNLAGTVAYANCNMTINNLSCIPPPHHYEIQGPASGTNCANHTFTIKAWADATQTTAYTSGVTTGTLTSSGNPASLPSLGAFTIPAGSSTVNITPIAFPSTGSTTFNTSAVPPLTGATTCNFGGSTSCTFSVVSCVTDFNCVETTANASSAADSNTITGRLYTKLASTAFSFDVVARKADATVATSYASDADKPVTVELVDGSGATVCASRGALNPTVSSQILTFTKVNQPTEQGRKSISFTVPNVYKDVRCRVTDNSNTAIKGCSSDNFAIRPTNFTVSSTNANADATGASTTATPNLAAGSNFSLTAATGFSGYNGTPSIDNTKLVAHSSALQAGSFTGAFGAASAGTAIGAAFTYDEVGYFRFNANGIYDDTFAAIDSVAGDCASGFTNSGGKFSCNFGNASVTNFFGRFTPDHFDTVVTQGCSAGGFTYSAQPFNTEIIARNLNGGRTQNYHGASSFSKTTTLSDANSAAGSLVPASVAANSFIAGIANASPAFTFTLAKTAPAVIKLRAVDTDSVTSSTTEGTGIIRSGRLRLQNAYGSELLALPIPLEAQYWNGSSYIRNQLDNCTTVPASSIAMSNYKINLSNALPVCETQLVYISGTGLLVNGVSSLLRLTKPGSGNNGSVDLTINLNTANGKTCISAAESNATSANIPWFGAYPSSRATFGIYKTPIIYLRENY
ncbi:MAG: hypothetical protein Q8M99_01675 [Methylotenera sp.]|nr:hypothetical protein [Methylotenera sp.]